MAEYFHTTHIAASAREFVKSESRRIRLAGVRARVVVFSIDAPPVLSALRAFSWADITVKIIRLRGNTESMKAEILKSCADSSVHGIIITDPENKCHRILELFDLIPAEKDVLCCGSQALSALLSVGKSAFLPCRTDALLRMLSYADIDLQGKSIFILGDNAEMRSLFLALTNSHACVTLSPTLDEKNASLCRQADILISSLGIPGVITSRCVRDCQTVVDAGFFVSDTEDVNIDSVEPYVSAIFSGDDNSFNELCDYIATEHVLTCAAEYAAFD